MGPGEPAAGGTDSSREAERRRAHLLLVPERLGRCLVAALTAGAAHAVLLGDAVAATARRVRCTRAARVRLNIILSHVRFAQGPPGGTSHGTRRLQGAAG